MYAFVFCTKLLWPCIHCCRIQYYHIDASDIDSIYYISIQSHILIHMSFWFCSISKTNPRLCRPIVKRQVLYYAVARPLCLLGLEEAIGYGIYGNMRNRFVIRSNNSQFLYHLCQRFIVDSRICEIKGLNNFKHWTILNELFELIESRPIAVYRTDDDYPRSYDKHKQIQIQMYIQAHVPHFFKLQTFVRAV